MSSMKRRSVAVLAALLVLGALPPSLFAQRKKGGDKGDVNTAFGKFPLEISSEYLGMANGKTVVRIRLASPELTSGLAAKGVRGFSGTLTGLMTWVVMPRVTRLFRRFLYGDR